MISICSVAGNCGTDDETDKERGFCFARAALGFQLRFRIVYVKGSSLGLQVKGMNFLNERPDMYMCFCTQPLCTVLFLFQQRRESRLFHILALCFALTSHKNVQRINTLLNV